MFRRFTVDQQGGFTLIEVLLVMALTALIVSMSISTVQNARFGKQLDEATEVVASNLERARNFSLAAKVASNAIIPTTHGVYLSTNSVVFHEGTGYDPSAPTAGAVTYKLPNGVTIANGTLSDGDDVSFRRLTGESTRSGTIILVGRDGAERAIRVYSSGAIERAVPASVAFKGGFRRKIMLNNAASASSSGDVENLPVLIKLTVANAGGYGTSGTLYNVAGWSLNTTTKSFDNLSFVDSNGFSYLPYEVESWNVSGDSYIWVLVPKVEKTNNDFIYVYYGTPARSIPENNFRDTWVDYIGVWHANSTNLDSSPAALAPGIIGGTVSNSLTSVAGYSYVFTTPNYGYIEVKPETPSGDYSMEAWVRYASISGDGKIFGKQDGGVWWDGTKWIGFFLNTYYGAVFQIKRGAVTDHHWGVATNNWIGLAVRHTWNGSSGNVDGFVNGVGVNNPAGGATTPTTFSTHSFYIGGDPYLFGRAWNGFIDEVRISKKTRTDAWFKSSYSSIINPAGFAPLGSVEPL